MPYKPKAPPVMATPNVIPMADIMLVLLIIFMVVTPMLQKGVSVDMARVENQQDMQAADRDDAVLLAVTRDGNYFLGTTQVSLADITNKVEAFDVEMDNSSMELINYFITRRGGKK